MSLVERLKEAGSWCYAEDTDFISEAQLFKLSADRIEALEAENERLNGERIVLEQVLQLANAKIEKDKEENERLKAEWAAISDLADQSGANEALPKELASAQAENERISKLCTTESSEWARYCTELKEQLAAAQAESESNRRQANYFHCENSRLNTNCVNTETKLSACQDENLKLREALVKAANFIQPYNIANDLLDELDAALATTTETTAITEYRNSVIEECAKVCNNWNDGYDIKAIELGKTIRAMKEKP